jgi:hypothetical protein
MNSLEAKLAELTVSPCINAIGEKKNWFWSILENLLNQMWINHLTWP